MPTRSNTEPPIDAAGPIDGRMKVIDPLMSTGPSTKVQVLRWSDSELSVCVPRRVLVGATVHLRTAGKIIIGEVRRCEPNEGSHEISVLVKEIL